LNQPFSKKKRFSFFENIDNLFVVSVALLLMGGMVMMTSASMPVAARNFADPFHYFYKQGFAACLGLIVGFLFFLIPTNFWEKLGILTALIAIGLLALVYIPGIGLEANGAIRWVDIGPLPTIQVIDPARFLLIIYIAGYCFRQQKQVEMTFLSLIKLMIFILPACILLLLQPDFGSTVVLLAIVASLFFVAGFKFRYFFVLLLSLASVFWLLVYKVQYRLDRITSFLDPWADPLGDSYQLVNSLIAIGSGGWFGVGLGESMQKLGYLPEAHTDFIFAVIAEELGLIGVVLIIGIYALMIWRIFSISLHAMKHNRVFQGYFAFSVGIWITAQVVINIGVNMGVLPTKGLILPLISYGSNAMTMTLITLFIVLKIGCENPVIKANRRI
jgi:cell division protein FtsW